MLKLKNVSKYYHSNDVVAMGLRKVDLEFKLGEFIAVTGESGSGKSTLLNILSGLDTYEDGEMYVEDEETSYFSIEDWENYRRKYIGFVFQNYNIIDSYSVLENVMVALTIQGYNKETRKERALELIEKVGLTSHKNHKASKLSGGQKQRAVIARALAKDCPIIVADEPTGNLDSESSRRIIELLKEISKDKLVIIVTHNYDEVKEFATRKIRLFDGEVVEDKKIKTPQVVEKKVEVLPYKMAVLDLVMISLRNLFRVPKKTIFTFIVSLFIVFVFILTYGSFAESENYDNQNYNRYFSNVFKSRIIVTKKDDTAFTSTELTDLENINKVRDVLAYDITLDTGIAVFYVSPYEYSDFYYVNPLPATVLNDFDLKSGRFPANANEIVVGEHEIFAEGDTVTIMSGGESLYWRDPAELINDTDVSSSYTIVGFVESARYEYQPKVYFHSDYFEDEFVIANAVMQKSSISLSLGEFSYRFGSEQILFDNDLLDGEIALSEELNYEFISQLEITDPDGLEGTEFTLASNTTYEETSILVEFGGVSDDEMFWMDAAIYMNRDTFYLLFAEDSYQVSVLVYDFFDSESVIKTLEDSGYNVMYPAGAADPFVQIERMLSRIGMGIVLIIVMIVIYLVSYIVLKNIQSSKKKDYVIFRSIGASKKDLNKVTLFELIFTLSIAFVFTVALLLVNEEFDTRIPRYLRYFTFSSYAYVYILLMILAYLLGSKFNKKIFGSSVITSLRGE